MLGMEGRESEMIHLLALSEDEYLAVKEIIEFLERKELCDFCESIKIENYGTVHKKNCPITILKKSLKPFAK